MAADRQRTLTKLGPRKTKTLLKKWPDDAPQLDEELTSAMFESDASEVAADNTDNQLDLAAELGPRKPKTLLEKCIMSRQLDEELTSAMFESDASEVAADNTDNQLDLAAKLGPRKPKTFLEQLIKELTPARFENEASEVAAATTSNLLNLADVDKDRAQPFYTTTAASTITDASTITTAFTLSTLSERWIDWLHFGLPTGIIVALVVWVITASPRIVKFLRQHVPCLRTANGPAGENGPMNNRPPRDPAQVNIQLNLTFTQPRGPAEENVPMNPR